MKMNKFSKIAASSVLTTAAVLQMAFGAFAAPANNAPLGDAHTTFGVVQSSATELKSQVAFEVPLYVTMVALSATDKMTLPTGYDIYNAGKEYKYTDPLDNKEHTLGKIGVTRMVAQHFGGTWDVVDNAYGFDNDKTNNTKDATKMTFKIGGIDLKALDKNKPEQTLIDYHAVKGEDGSLANFAASNQFVNVVDAQHTEKNKVVAIAPGSKLVGGKIGISLDSKIKNIDQRAADLKTTAAFKVMYTISALDKDGNPITSGNTYIGDNAIDAGYENNWAE